MFDHIRIVTRDRSLSLRFYQACLPPLGYVQTDSQEGAAVFRGRNGTFLWIGSQRPAFWNDSHSPGSAPLHLCLIAPNQDAVDAFHHAAVSEGGKDNGLPGARGEGQGTYSALVLDPDGNNIEAAFRTASG